MWNRVSVLGISITSYDCRVLDENTFTLVRGLFFSSSQSRVKLYKKMRGKFPSVFVVVGGNLTHFYVSLKLCFRYFFMLQIIFMTFINSGYFVERLCYGIETKVVCNIRRRSFFSGFFRYNLNWNVGSKISSRERAIAMWKWENYVIT